MKKTFRKPWFAFVMGFFGSLVLLVGFYGTQALLTLGKGPTVGLGGDSKLSIERTIMHQDDDVTITAVSISTDPTWGNVLDVELENKTDIDYNYSIDRLAVNGIIMPSRSIGEVAPANSKKLIEVPLEDSFYKGPKIDKIRDIAFDISFEDPLSTDLDTGKFVIIGLESKTNYFGDGVQAKDELKGTTISSVGDVKVNLTGEKGSFVKDDQLTVSVENNTDSNIRVVIYKYDFSSQDSYNPIAGAVHELRPHTIMYEQSSIVMGATSTASELLEKGDKLKATLFIVNLDDGSYIVPETVIDLN